MGFEMKNEESFYTVSVNMRGGSCPQMLQFCISYDNKKLELVSVAQGEAFKGLPAPTVSNSDVGKIYLVWDALDPLPDGTLLIMKLKAVDSAEGETTIYFDPKYETVAADGDYNEIELFLGSIEIAFDTNDNDHSDPPSEIVKDDDHTIVIQTGDSYDFGGDFQDYQYICSNDNVSYENGALTGLSQGFCQVVLENKEGSQETFYITVLDENDYLAYKTMKKQKMIISILTGISIGLVAVISLLLIKRNKRNVLKKGRKMNNE